jgi:hypothetical protein
MNVPKSLRDESQWFILGSIVRMLRQVRSKRWTKKWLVQVYARSYLIYRETLGEYFSYLEKELRADREYELTTELVPSIFPKRARSIVFLSGKQSSDVTSLLSHKIQAVNRTLTDEAALIHGLTRCRRSSGSYGTNGQRLTDS